MDIVESNIASNSNQRLQGSYNRGKSTFSKTGLELQHPVKQLTITARSTARMKFEFQLREILSGSAKDLSSRGLWRACLAECVGSLILLFFCCGPNVDYPPGQGASFSIDAKAVRCGLTSGLTVACLVWSLGHISGAHINPALTLAFLITGKISVVRALFYIPMQCTGGVAGTLLLKLLTPFQLHNQTTFGLNSYDAALMHPAQAFGVEFVLTFVSFLPVFASMDRLRFDQTGSVPLICGLQVSVCIFVGAVLSGASMNPIRTLGPAVAIGRYDQLWVYILGPSCGGCLCGVAYQMVFKGSLMLPAAAESVSDIDGGFGNGSGAVSDSGDSASSGGEGPAGKRARTAGQTGVTPL